MAEEVVVFEKCVYRLSLTIIVKRYEIHRKTIISRMSLFIVGKNIVMAI